MCCMCLGSNEEYQKLSRDIQALYIATHNEDGKRIEGMDIDDLKTKMKRQSKLGLGILRECLKVEG